MLEHPEGFSGNTRSVFANRLFVFIDQHNHSIIKRHAATPGSLLG
jgi:hypothetical protein